ncbi:unnamed protein product [Soboliphyme baturini]|uniref:Major sperm protein n=1 Tax=Soboliphyme baturini TaxID=241478 RepID=A0A183J867_9BILA|nr:unnamed protein product [Soboliphyme baturini]
MAKAEPEESPKDDNEETKALEQVYLSTQSLTFREPFTEDKTETIQVVNPTEKTIGFKVKSTRPKELLARPPFVVLTKSSGSYVKIKYCKLPEGQKPLKKDRLTFVFAVVPEGTKLKKPSELWKGKDGPPKTTRSITLKIIGSVEAAAVEERASSQPAKEGNGLKAAASSKSETKPVEAGTPETEDKEAKPVDEKSSKDIKPEKLPS